MFALGLKRTIASLLATTLLSSQLIASIPGLCSCSGSFDATEKQTCCVDSHSFSAYIPKCCATEGDGNSCGCGDDCGEKSADCDCGCGSHSDEQQAPTERNHHNRIRVGEQLSFGMAGTSTHLIQQTGRTFVCPADSCGTNRISTQILFCVWQI